MEIIAGSIDRQDRDRMRPDVEIQRATNLLGGKRLRQIDVGYLAQGVDAGIGPAGPLDEDLHPGHPFQRRLQHFLDRQAIGLALPADQAGAVIFEGEFVARQESSRIGYEAIRPCAANSAL